VVLLERKVAEERTLRESIEQHLSDLRNQMGSSSVSEIVAKIQASARLEDLKVGVAEFKQIGALVTAFAADAEKTHEVLAAKSQILSNEVKKQVELWKGRERTILSEIEQRKKELLAKGIKLDGMYIKKHLKSLKVLADWEKKLRELRQQRVELLKNRLETRTAISKRRGIYAVKANNALKSALADLSVDIKFIEGTFSPEAEEIIKEAMNWRTSQVPRAALLVSQIPLPDLIAAIRKTNVTPLLSVTAQDGTKPFNHTDALETLKVLLEPPTIYRLERCIFEDRPKITITRKVILTTGQVRYLSRDFSKLSLGQQQSVLLALMLASDSNNPHH
jgi:hypothetical protein